MRRNRIMTLIAGMVLSTTLAVSSPLTAFGTDLFDNAGSGDTETYEDSMYVGADEFSEDDYSDEDYSEDDYSGESDGSGDIEEPAVVYTVTYDLNGHGESYNEEVEEGYSAEGLADTPMDDGYEFLGWFTDKKCQTPWDGAVTSNLTVYAGWEEIPQEPQEPEVPEEPEVIEAPQQTDDAGSGETEGTEEAAGAAGQEEGAGAAGTGDQAAQIEDGNTVPSDNTAGAGTTAQETAEEDDDENVSEEAADEGDEGTVIKTQPEDVEVKESEKAEFKIELNENLEGIDYSKVTYQWYKVSDGGEDGEEGEGEGEGGDGEEAAVAAAITGNETAKTPKFVIESVKKDDEGSYFCRVSCEGREPEDSDWAELTVIPDLTAMSRPQDQTVAYPAGATFSVTPSDSATYQWYIHDKATGKDVKLDGLSATTATLIIPSTTKDDDGQKFFCEISEGGKTVKTEKATLKISNKDKDKPVLYVGNYALDLTKEASSSSLYINDIGYGFNDTDSDGKNAVGNHDQNFIEFDYDKKIITFNNVYVINTNAVYDHAYSPAAGIYLSGTGEKEYTINLVGTNKITLTDLKSVRDDKASALRFNSGNSKKKSEIKIKGKGTLTTKSGKTAIVSDGSLDISTTITINHEKTDTILNGIECENLNLSKGSVLTADVYGTGVYAHDKFKMESGSKAVLQSYVYKPPVKDAVLYAGKKISIDGAAITVIANPGDECTVKTFSGIETAGDIVISGDSDVKVNAPCAVYGMKTAGELSLKDSNMNITAGPTDGTSKAYGVVCGSSRISLSKEKKYVVQSKVADGIAFAALTGKSGNKEQGYQENYTPKKITFETADILVPAAHEISTGSIKDGSKYIYVETVYKKGETASPVTGVRFESTKHEWGEPVYTWSKDYSTVQAEVVCKNYQSHKLKETVKTTSKKTKEATCTEKAQTTYTAVFKNSVFEKQTKVVDTGKALGHKFGEWVIITRPTLTATGEKKHTCERCKKVETAVIPKLTKGTYKVKKGASLEWTKGSGKSLEVKIIRETENSTAFSHFQGILVDGKVLKKDYYKAKSGSVVITFKKDFLSKLAVGTHTLTYGFEDGDNPKSTLVIKNATGNSNSNSKTSSGTSGKGTTSAKTGDTTNIFLWVLTLCAAGAAVVLIQRYKKNNKQKDQDKDKGSDSTKK